MLNRVDLPRKQLLVEAVKLIERKLAGQRRQEALSFTRGRLRTGSELKALIKRLEPLPDTGAQHSNAKFSRETRVAIAQAYADGMPMEDICKRFDCGHATVASCAQEANVPLRKSGPPTIKPSIIARIREMRRNGSTYETIAEQCGVSIATAYRYGKDAS